MNGAETRVPTRTVRGCFAPSGNAEASVNWTLVTSEIRPNWSSELSAVAM